MHKFGPIVCTVALSAILSGQGINEEQILLPSVNQVDDGFGLALAISGSLAVIGSPGSSGNGPYSGAAYVFDLDTGLELRRLLPSDGEAYDLFGSSVATDGTTLLIGAVEGGLSGSDTGAAYLFDIASGTQKAKLLASDGVDFDRFGASAAISGSYALVGAPNKSSGFVFNFGALYVFDLNTGLEVFKVLPSDSLSMHFGFSLASNDSQILVGAFDARSFTTLEGTAVVLDSATGLEIRTLFASDGEAQDFFGYSVAMNDTLALVGAFGDDDKGGNAGAAYIFDLATGQELFKLLADDGLPGDFFGYSVALDGRWAIVGADSSDDAGFDSGAAYVFDVFTGELLSKLIPSDGSTYRYFGGVTAVQDRTVLVGTGRLFSFFAPKGATYLFELASGTTTLNNGAGGNPLVLDDGGIAPALGSAWPLVVDTGSGGYSLSTTILYEGSLAPGTLVVAAGEVIVDPSTVNYQILTVSGTGSNDHQVLIPADASILGITFTAQAILQVGAPIQLSNGLDLAIGF